MPPKILRTLDALRRETATWANQGLSSAIVPTMGALHEGHLQLVRQGFEKADRLVTTIFVNPKQFAANEDLARYPRTEESDLALLTTEGVNSIFAPTSEEIYALGFATTVHVEGQAKAGLEDKYRPQFFDGVATIVAKLLITASADFAMFGQKDYQQLQVVTRMAADLGIVTKIIGVATEREADGLALSSRNRFLSKSERHHASAIYKNLAQAAEKIRAGIKPQTATRAAARSLTTLGFKVDYVAVRNAVSLALPQNPNEPLRLLAAAWLGKIRLIDNIAV